MRPGFLAVLTLLALGAGAAALPVIQIPCPDTYKEEYRTTWGVERSYWNDSCQDGFKPADILREGQRRYALECIRDFAQAVADRKARLDAVEKLCSQGVGGRARLAKALGMPSEPAKPAESPAAASRPKPRGMGPLPEAVRLARSGWQPDACLCGMTYDSVYGRDSLADFAAPETPRDRTAFYFYSRTDPTTTYRVSYPGSREPELERGSKKFNELCITSLDVELSRALEIAAGQGIVLDPDREHARRSELRLQTYPKGHFSKSKLDRATAAKLRSIEGRPVWIAATQTGVKGKTAMIDAHSGAVVIVLPRALFLE